MNNDNFNPKMSEETFEVLLDLMEKHFSALRILDNDSECKLTRSTSFSELQTASKTKSVLLGESHQSGSCESLIKEYNWANSNIRLVKVPKAVDFRDDERRSLCKKTAPEIEINSQSNQKQSAEKLNHKEKKMPEFMEVEQSHTDTDTLTPRKSFSSLLSIQSAPSNSLALKVSSNSLQISLPRSSRSDISNLSNSREDNKEAFNVSKSFGQFTFGPKENQSNDSKKPCSLDLPVNEQEMTSPDCQKQKIEGRKKVLRPLMQKKEKKPTYSCSCWQIIFFSLLPVAVVLISTILNQQQVGSKFCDPSFNFTNVTENLPKLVHGQIQGVADLATFLENDLLKFKIIALVGGTGVGKTHVANIIKHSLPDSFYAFEYFPPLFNKVRQAYSMLSTCRCNLIILENLGTDDISDAAFFSHSLKNRDSDLCVLILALFNTQVTDNNLKRSMDLKGSVSNIENGFKKEGVDMKAIGFEPLDEESILECIKEAIADSHLKLVEEDIDQIRKSLLIANSGCKGAYSKVQLLGKFSN